MLELPAQISVRDELERSRLTVFFRLLLAVPHLVWLYVWTIAAYPVAIVAWIAALIRGELPAWAHRFFSALVRYRLHVFAFASLAANPFPGFVGAPGGYPIDARFPDPAPQNRWTIAFRVLLGLPAFVLTSALNLVAEVVAILAWFACLAIGRIPLGFRDALVYALGYDTQTYAYLFLLSDRYPSSDPAAVPLAEAPAHPVRLTVADDLRRDRLTTFFRLLLSLPHLVWLSLWAVVVEVTVLVAWAIALFSGRVPGGLHNFMSAYVRYQAHVSAYLYLAANPFPGFTGVPGSYPVDLEVPAPQRQSRAVVAFRLFLSLPAFLVATALTYAQLAAALLGWCAALVTGTMPRGLRNLVVYGVRYSGQLYAYALLLTERYPYTGPGPVDRTEPEPVPAAGPLSETAV